MSEEMKLLMALCDALGFEVVGHVDDKRRKEKHPPPKVLYMDSFPPRVVMTTNGAYERDEDGMYTSRLLEPETSYTVTKKESTGEEG